MRKEITEDQITQLLAGIPRAEKVDRLKAEIERLTRERDEARAENQRLRAERDTLLLDARDFLRWFNRSYPDPSNNPDHPWCVINLRLNAHADTLRALDSGLGAKP